MVCTPLKPTSISPIQIYALALESSPPQPSNVNGPLQLRTVFGIVIGLLGFVLLLFSFSFLYRRCCRPEATPPRSPPRPSRGNVPRRRPRERHVEDTIATPMTSLTSSREDRAPPPPPYDGQSFRHIPSRILWTSYAFLR
ncbi:hypothetical protein BU15DRAFT_81598 [Melanogaster broomeanus]|nr:hypothetical protein BU15DRAFT_81598 [Melanogaster broomeanus]